MSDFRRTVARECGFDCFDRRVFHPPWTPTVACFGSRAATSTKFIKTQSFSLPRTMVFAGRAIHPPFRLGLNGTCVAIVEPLSGDFECE
jgi:hypothetical protein